MKMTSKIFRQVSIASHFEIGRNINEKTEVEHQIEKLCVKKAELSNSRLAFLGMLSGIWMVMAASFANLLASGIDKEVVELWPLLPRIIIGLSAPVAMHFIVVFGGEFYSGNTMYFGVGLMKKRVTLLQAVHNLVSVFFWNAMGIVISAFLFTWLTQIFMAEPTLSFIRAAAEAKAKISFGISFARAIPANVLICTAIQMGISAREMTGKLLALHIPLTVYLVAGFEHCITNIVIVTFGVMHGADVDMVFWLFNNLLASTLGNLVGGGLVVGGFVTLLYSWDEEHGNTNMPALETIEGAFKKLAKVPLTLANPFRADPTRRRSVMDLMKGRRGSVVETELEATKKELEAAQDKLREMEEMLLASYAAMTAQGAATAAARVLKEKSFSRENSLSQSVPTTPGPLSVQIPPTRGSNDDVSDLQ